MKKILLFIVGLIVMAGMSGGVFAKEPERNLYVNGTQIGEGLIVELATTEEVELLTPLKEALDALGLNVTNENGGICFHYSKKDFIFQFDLVGFYHHVNLTTMNKKDSIYADDYIDLGTCAPDNIYYFINGRIYLDEFTAQKLFFFLGCEITFDEDMKSIRINKSAEPEQSIRRCLDITSRDWFRFSVEYVLNKKYMECADEMYFSPNAPATRSTIATVLYNMAGKPTDFIYSPHFDDVSNLDTEHVSSLMWAQSCGIAKGVTNNRFNPNGKVTRQDFAVMFLRYIKYCGFELPQIDSIKAFADEADISDYAKEAVHMLNYINVLKGRDENTIDPKSNVTRAEVAVMIQRMMNYFTNDTGDVNYL